MLFRRGRLFGLLALLVAVFASALTKAPGPCLGLFVVWWIVRRIVWASEDRKERRALRSIAPCSKCGRSPAPVAPTVVVVGDGAPAPRHSDNVSGVLEVLRLVAELNRSPSVVQGLELPAPLCLNDCCRPANSTHPTIDASS